MNNLGVFSRFYLKLAALAAGGVMTAATLRIGEYRTFPRATFTAPHVPRHHAANDNPFSADKPRSPKTPVPHPMPKGVWSSNSRHHAGRITFAANHGNPAVHTLTTELGADRFVGVSCFHPPCRDGKSG